MKNKINPRYYRLYMSIAMLSSILNISGCDDSRSTAVISTESLNMHASAITEKNIESLTHQNDVAPIAEEKLPDNLKWVTNTEDEIFADTSAKRGGTFRTYITSFPLTLRKVGPDSNGSFAGYLRGLQMELIDFHPNTLNPIPALATHWAFDADQKTVYYKLDSDARWSDGKLITADDYLFTIEFMRSKHIIAPWYNEYYSKQITKVIKYDDYTIAVRSGHAKPRDELIAATAISPMPKHFHQLDKNWIRNYNWKKEPTTAAYIVGKIQKGKYVEFKRLKNWWANDKMYYKHRFNVDKVRVKVIRDTNIAWTYFLKGELDSFSLMLPSFWHEKAQGELFDKGYIHKIKFYNKLPQPAAGMWLNTAKKNLSDLNVRIGLAHAINIDKVNNTVLHGDYERLNSHHVGFENYSNTSIKPREFNLEKSDYYFNLAGWTTLGPDGIRIKDGERLTFQINYGAQHYTNRLVVIKEEAKKAGVELNLNLLGSAASFKQILEKKHEIAWMAWSGGGLTPKYWQFYHSVNANKAQTNNITNYSDPVLDKLIETYRKELSKEKRIELAHQLEQMIHESGVMIPTTMAPYTRESYWAWLKLPTFYGNKRSSSLISAFNSGLFWIDTEYKKIVENAYKEEKKLTIGNILDETWK